MKTDMLFIFLTVGFCIFLIGCKPKIKNLKVKIKYDHLCVFTNNSKAYYDLDNTFIINLGKIDYTKKFKSTYEKLYTNVPLPIDGKNYVAVLLNEIKHNVIYEIILDTNKSFHTSICVVGKDNKLEVRYVEPGKSQCN